MRFRLYHFAVSALVCIAACGGSSSPTSPSAPSNPSGPSTPTTPTQPAGPTQTNQVSIGNNFFSPQNIQVAPGTTVTWSWDSQGTAHNVTFTDGTVSGNRSSGTFTRTFTATGTFNYSCTLHPGMTGSVLVK